MMMEESLLESVLKLKSISLGVWEMENYKKLHDLSDRVAWRTKL